MPLWWSGAEPEGTDKNRLPLIEPQIIPNRLPFPGCTQALLQSTSLGWGHLLREKQLIRPRPDETKEICECSRGQSPIRQPPEPLR